MCIAQAHTQQSSWDIDEHANPGRNSYLLEAHVADRGMLGGLLPSLPVHGGHCCSCTIPCYQLQRADGCCFGMLSLCSDAWLHVQEQEHDSGIPCQSPRSLAGPAASLAQLVLHNASRLQLVGSPVSTQ